jgi:biotin carboxylase
MNKAMEKSSLVIDGSGGRPYREYSFAVLARSYRLFAVLPAAPTWQRGYLDGFAVVDVADPDAIATAVSTLAGDGAEVGVLTWDETVLEATAQAAEQLGLPHMSAQAAARCRDKYATRELMAAAGLPAVRFRLAATADEAVSAAAELGFPVVVKPRALAGSMGVAVAPDEAAVREAFEAAATSRYADLPTGHGVLIEEYLDGPEISVDSAVLDGVVRCVHVAYKRLGFPPGFEEVGHLVGDWSTQPWAAQVEELVVGAHHALGVTHGVTHAEVRLTAAGPRLVELNGRLGGDLIPYLSELATGIDLVAAAGRLAFGRAPRLIPIRHRTAEVRFVYPPYDCVVQDLDVGSAGRTPGIAYAAALAAPGDTMVLPPRSTVAVPRLAALVAVGQDEQECAEVLDRAAKAVTVQLTPHTHVDQGLCARHAGPTRPQSP